MPGLIDHIKIYEMWEHIKMVAMNRFKKKHLPIKNQSAPARLAEHDPPSMDSMNTFNAFHWSRGVYHSVGAPRQQRGNGPRKIAALWSGNQPQERVMADTNDRYRMTEYRIQIGRYK